MSPNTCWLSIETHMRFESRKEAQLSRCLFVREHDPIFYPALCQRYFIDSNWDICVAHWLQEDTLLLDTGSGLTRQSFQAILVRHSEKRILTQTANIAQHFLPILQWQSRFNVGPLTRARLALSEVEYVEDVILPLTNVTTATVASKVTGTWLNCFLRLRLRLRCWCWEGKQRLKLIRVNK